MSLTNAMETDLLELIFQAITWDNIAENDSTSPAANFYISLHTANPGEADPAQTASETTYGAYARATVARTTAGFTVAGNTADNAAAVTFVEATSGPSTVTYFGVGWSLTGAGNLMAYGTIDTPTAGLVVNSGVQPQFATGALDITLD